MGEIIEITGYMQWKEIFCPYLKKKINKNRILYKGNPQTHVPFLFIEPKLKFKCGAKTRRSFEFIEEKGKYNKNKKKQEQNKSYLV